MCVFFYEHNIFISNLLLRELSIHLVLFTVFLLFVQFIFSFSLILWWIMTKNKHQETPWIVISWNHKKNQIKNQILIYLMIFIHSNFFLIFIFTALSEDPEFTDVIENITVPAGRNIKLACSVKNLGSYKVIVCMFTLYSYLDCLPNVFFVAVLINCL